MNKLGIWVIAIVAAFVIGILSANPVVEAVEGWKAAVIELSGDISDIELFLEERSDFWEFLEESGEEAFESQVYEVSGVSVILKEGSGGGGGTSGTPVQLRCLDGDWLIDDDNDPQKTVVLSTGDLSPEDIEGGNDNGLFFRDIRARGILIHESETAISDEFTKTIGFDGFAESNNQNLPFDIPVTMTILCHSPSS